MAGVNTNTESTLRRSDRLYLFKKNINLSNSSNVYEIFGLSSQETALNRLAELASQEHAKDGPVDIGSFSDEDLDRLIKSRAGYYSNAFTQGIKCYPFMRGSK